MDSAKETERRKSQRCTQTYIHTQGDKHTHRHTQLVQGEVVVLCVLESLNPKVQKVLQRRAVHGGHRVAHLGKGGTKFEEVVRHTW